VFYWSGRCSVWSGGLIYLVWSFEACVSLPYILQGHWGSLVWIRFWYVVTTYWWSELFWDQGGRGCTPPPPPCLIFWPLVKIFLALILMAILSQLLQKEAVASIKRKLCCKKRTASKIFSLQSYFAYLSWRIIGVYSDFSSLEQKWCKVMCTCQQTRLKWQVIDGNSRMTKWHHQGHKVINLLQLVYVKRSQLYSAYS